MRRAGTGILQHGAGRLGHLALLMNRHDPDVALDDDDLEAEFASRKVVLGEESHFTIEGGAVDHVARSTLYDPFDVMPGGLGAQLKSAIGSDAASWLDET